MRQPTSPCPTRPVHTLSISLAAIALSLLLLVSTETPQRVPYAFADAPNADVALALAFASNEIPSGETFSYTHTIKNNGPDTASQVILNVRAPKGIAVESMVASRGDCVVTPHTARTVLRCAFGKIALAEARLPNVR